MSPRSEVQSGGAPLGAMLPLLLLGLYGVLGGATFTLSKIAVGAGMAPLAYGFWQCLGAAVLVATVALWRRERWPVAPAEASFCALTGIIGVALPLAVMYTAIAHMPAGVMGLLLATIPLFTIALSWLWGRTRPRSRDLLGIACGIAGACVLLLPRASLPTADALPWVLFAFLTPLLYGAGGLYAARARPAALGAAPLTVAMLLAACALLGPAALVAGNAAPPVGGSGAAGVALLAQILVSSVGYLLFFEIVRLGGAVFFSQIGYLVTLSGMGWAALAFGERYSAWVWLAVALMFAALALVNGGAAVAPAPSTSRRAWRLLRRAAP